MAPRWRRRRMMSRSLWDERHHGAPKGVMLTVRNIEMRSAMTLWAYPSRGHRFSWRCRRSPMRPGWSVFAAGARARMIVMAKPDLSEFLRLVEHHRSPLVSTADADLPAAAPRRLAARTCVVAMPALWLGAHLLGSVGGGADRDWPGDGADVRSVRGAIDDGVVAA